jgi:hypothetical protein
MNLVADADWPTFGSKASGSEVKVARAWDGALESINPAAKMDDEGIKRSRLDHRYHRTVRIGESPRSCAEYFF